MLDSIKISCFALAYAITLGLEISRLFFRLPVRMVIIFGMGLAGFVTHTLYLTHRGMTVGDGNLPLSSWYDWFLVAAWIIAAAYLLLLATRPETAIGMFLLPLTLLLVGTAYPLREMGTFHRERAVFSWQTAHGVALLLGMVTVTLGFAAGVMYLIQSYRLKHHLGRRQGFRLPSLEWLQRMNQQMLFHSTFLFALGLLSGIILNAVKRGQSTASVPWTDSVVISSSILLLWLVGSSTFEVLYKPAQQGRKVAYLTVASFGFLVVVVGMLVWSGSAHAPTQPSKVTIKARTRQRGENPNDVHSHCGPLEPATSTRNAPSLTCRANLVARTRQQRENPNNVHSHCGPSEPSTSTRTAPSLTCRATIVEAA